jgi:hypothetical protein
MKSEPDGLGGGAALDLYFQSFRIAYLTPTDPKRRRKPKNIAENC